jgi:GxxExxY protein
MQINELTEIIVETAYAIHREVPGLFESVYEVVLADALSVKGLQVKRQVIVPIRIGEKIFDEGFALISSLKISLSSRSSWLSD